MVLTFLLICENTIIEQVRSLPSTNLTIINLFFLWLQITSLIFPHIISILVFNPLDFYVFKLSYKIIIQYIMIMCLAFIQQHMGKESILLCMAVVYVFWLLYNILSNTHDLSIKTKT